MNEAVLIAGHTAGLRLLRVAAWAGAEHGRESIARLYEAFGTHIFEAAPDTDQRSEGEVRERRGTREFVEPILAESGLPLELAEALDDDFWDREIRQETDEALALTGKDVGTPIIHFEPPAGVAFFGPVISRLPEEQSAAEVWDHVVGLARFPVFAELKRSLRERPQLPAPSRSLAVSAIQKAGALLSLLHVLPPLTKLLKGGLLAQIPMRFELDRIQGRGIKKKWG